ncbi:MAG TPA: strawberry notch family protein, partial [Longimicrobium sp.]|nr:strawberry notch family protein [Longimicrobium sp.]
MYALLAAAASALPSGAPFRTAAEAVAWGGEVLGLPYPGGGWTLDDVYDAVEGAAHHRLAGAFDHLPLGERIRAAAERETEWFHGRALTEQARAEAQFSTPLPIAEGAAAVVAAARVHSVLEPCAGTGSLVRPLLHRPRMQLFLNEPDPRRRDILLWLGFKPTDRDALRLPMERVRFDAVLSNPPFGAMNRGRGGRGATEFAATNIAQRFAAAHLRSLRPHGLLVALLPASTLSDAGVEFRRWIEQHHTPLLYLECPEGSYRSRGALRDAMLLVARQGKAADSAERVLVTSPSWDTWTDAVESVASRVSGSARMATAAEVQQPGSADRAVAPPARPAIIVPPTRPSLGTVPGADAPANSTGGATEAGPAARSPAQHPSAIEGDTTGEPASALARAANTVEEEPTTDPHSAAPEGAELNRAAAPAAVYGALDLEFGAPAPLPRSTPDWAREGRERQAAEASNVFAPFVVALQERRAPHPRLVVETRSMAGMPAPALQRQRFASPLADDAWGRSGEHGGASDEQAELSLRALDAWDRGHGFLCADDVGVGKSREIALLILEAIEEGATRILLTTKNENNVRDLEHELRRVASGRQHGPFPAQIIEVANYREAKGDEGVLPRPVGPTVYLAHAYNLADFSHALIGVQPTVWLADEAHEFSNVADSKRGIAWTEIHQAMLKYTARFAYFTATPAVTLNQLCYLYGLRLWSVGAFDAWLARKTGKGNPDETEEETSAAEDAVEDHRTEAALVGESSGLESGSKPKRDYIRADAFSIRTTPAETEQVMRELRGSGHYMSRDLWRGGVSFEVEWIDLLGDPAALARYNEAAELCRDLSLAARQFGMMNEKVAVTGLDRAMIQGYLKQLLFDLRLDSILRRADQALDQGRKVVISIHSVAGDEDDVEALSAEDQEHPVSHRLEA